jgi:hypothetical protein
MFHINKMNNIPFYILLPLIVVKNLYYRLNVISKDLFNYIKNLLFSQQDLDRNLIALKF